jgi:hypothetical protein
MASPSMDMQFNIRQNTMVQRSRSSIEGRCTRGPRRDSPTSAGWGMEWRRR